MPSEIFVTLLISLLLTLVLELFFAFICKIRRRTDFLLVALVNLLTNPPTVLAYYLLKDAISISPVYIIIVLEIAVVAVEGLCYKHCTKGIAKPFLFSLSANSFSYFLGFLISKLF